MRAAALILAILAFTTTQDDLQQEDHSRRASQCAAIPKDAHGMKACSCAARKGQGCDANGNRVVEEMEGCVNRQHCLRGCCHCCPKD